MEAKHTPGPWYSGPWIDRKKAITDSPKIQAGKLSTGTNLIATIWPISPGNHHQANADLIAASPDLLAALEVLTKHAQEVYPHFESERGQRDIRAAIDAIAKAKGEN